MLATISSQRNPRLSSTDTYFRDVGKTSVLTPSEENTLCRRVQDGDAEARDHLIRSNLRLVVSIAGVYRRVGVEMEDLIAEGNLGLIRAAEAFDPDVGTRFSTYAAYWIKQSIKRLIVNTAKPIRLPAYMNDLMVKWQRAKKSLQVGLKRVPTFEEIAELLKLCPKKLAIIRKAIRIYNAAPATGQHDDPHTIESTLVDEDVNEPVQTLGQQEDIGKVLQLLDSMDEREATVLRRRFGLGGEDPMTLVEIGERLGLTRERVRQIEKEALQRLAEKLER